MPPDVLLDRLNARLFVCQVNKFTKAVELLRPTLLLTIVEFDTKASEFPVPSEETPFPPLLAIRQFSTARTGLWAKPLGGTVPRTVRPLLALYEATLLRMNTSPICARSPSPTLHSSRTFSIVA